MVLYIKLDLIHWIKGSVWADGGAGEVAAALCCNNDFNSGPIRISEGTARAIVELVWEEMPYDVVKIEGANFAVIELK